MTDGDHFVRNAVSHLAGDLDSPELYGRLSASERAATLLWVMDRRIRIDGIGGWIETHGQHSDDTIAALIVVGATDCASLLDRAFALIPTRTADDPDARLSAMDSWTPEQAETWRRAEAEYFAIARRDNLIDKYVRPFVASRPQDFPGSG